MMLSIEPGDFTFSFSSAGVQKEISPMNSSLLFDINHPN